jgi:hypothetical protein
MLTRNLLPGSNTMSRYFIRGGGRILSQFEGLQRIATLQRLLSYHLSIYAIGVLAGYSNEGQAEARIFCLDGVEGDRIDNVNLIAKQT